MSQTAFFTEHELPVFTCLSSDSKRQLEAYLNAGNTSFRQQRLLEFFKTIDWLEADAIVGHRLLQKLPSALSRQLRREIEDYRNQKAENRVQNAEKREQYRLRVFEYFRIKVPTADKALLESLRDYELDLTGRDANWRHYFTLDSFKKIDTFIRAGAEERQAWVAQFRRDVDTYKKNYDKLHAARTGASCDHGFTFDDWCDLMGDEAPNLGAQGRNHAGGKQSRANAGSTSTEPDSVVFRAYRTLELNWGASPDQVKKQFRQLTLAHHPDLPDGSEEKMKAIVGAYAELKRYWQAQASVL